MLTRQDATTPELLPEYIVNSRDLRLDYLRGLIMLLVIATHLEYFSIFSMFAWERIGLISSAEGFVTLSGMVLGLVYRKKLLQIGFWQATWSLWKRAFQLYRVNLAIILSILLLSHLSFVNVNEVTHWINPVSKQAYPLFPPEQSSWKDILASTALLQIGPHQFQIIGFYCIVLVLAPMALLLLHYNLTPLLMLTSWAIYLINSIDHLKVTAALFERAFPLLTWQVLFFNGMIIGYHHHKVFDFLSCRITITPVVTAAISALMFLLLAQHNPNPIFWPLDSLSILDSSVYSHLYFQWFDKTTLGIGRIINNVALFVVMFYLLTQYWAIFNRFFGWLLIPFGQASLYVFIIHVYLIIIINSTPLPGYNRFSINSAIHLSSILLIWLMIKRRLLFSFIPR